MPRDDNSREVAELVLAGNALAAFLVATSSREDSPWIEDSPPGGTAINKAHLRWITAVEKLKEMMKRV